MNAELTKLQTVFENKGGEHMGDVAFPRFRNAIIKRFDLETLANKVGFPVDLLPEGLTPEKAWNYTLTRQPEGGTKGTKKMLVRKIHETDNSSVWGLVEENADAAVESLRYIQLSRLTLDKKTGIATYEVPNNPKVVEIDQKFQSLVGSVTTDQVRQMVVATCRDNNGAPVGTAWFVPATSATLMRSMRDLVNQLGESELWLLPIYDSVESRDAINRAVRADLQDQINSLKEEMAKWDDSTRESTMEKRLSRFEEIRQQANLYAGILDVLHGDLLEEVTSMEKKVKELICGPATK